ncbi:MAG: clostripain-related cysteine peptidase [Spirochaetia bacterium]
MKSLEPLKSVWILIFFYTAFFTACSGPFHPSNPDTSDNNAENDELPAVPESWTVLVYANGDNNLEQYIAQDLKEMELADTTGADITILVLLDRIKGYSAAYGDFADTRLYQVVHTDVTDEYASLELESTELGLTPGDTREELNMGDWQTLRNFISFGISYSNTDNYALIIEDHGDGWFTSNAQDRGVSWDSSSFSSFIGTDELSLALGDSFFDILFLDACQMGTLEVAYELSDFASYFIASPQNIPAGGMDYQSLFTRLGSTDSKPAAWAQAFCTDFAETYPGSDIRIHGFSLDALRNGIDDQMPDMVRNLYDMSYEEVFSGFQNSEFFFSRNRAVYRDLLGFAESLGLSSVVDAINAASLLPDPELSVFFPEYMPDYDSAYTHELAFTVNTGWDEWLLSWLESSPSGADSNEPGNNTFHNPVPIENNVLAYGYISAPLDEDYYSFSLASETEVSISLSVPEGVDYHLVLERQFINGPSEIEGSELSGKGMDENIVCLCSTGEYFVRVFPASSSDFSASAEYSLLLSY